MNTTNTTNTTIDLSTLIFDPLEDNISRLELIQYCGNDKMIVDAARVSHGRDRLKSEFDIEKDSNLIRYLLVNQHGTPFEQNSLTLHFILPIFVARQFIRHRIGWSYNEISGRYTELPSDFYRPKHWRAQDTKNKQGSLANVIISEDQNLIAGIHNESIHNSYEAYQKLLEFGVAKEMARLVLPVCIYTRWYATTNLRALMLFYVLRADNHAQWEAQQYALKISEICKVLFPVTWNIFLELLELKEFKEKYIRLHRQEFDYFIAAEKSQGGYE